jgi:Mn2+/Fe2+ NRAMP family transporter
MGIFSIIWTIIVFFAKSILSLIGIIIATPILFGFSLIIVIVTGFIIYTILLLCKKYKILTDEGEKVIFGIIKEFNKMLVKCTNLIENLIDQKESEKELKD